MKKVTIEKLDNAYRITEGNYSYRYPLEEFDQIFIDIKEYFAKNDNYPKCPECGHLMIPSQVVGYYYCEVCEEERISLEEEI